jgi:plastocyanin
VKNRVVTIGAATLVLALGAAACGGDDDDEGEESAATTTEETSAGAVNVIGDDFSFELSATPSADTQEITFENVGKEPHEILFAKLNEGVTIDEAIEAQGRKGTTEMIGATFAKPGEEGKPIEVKQPLEPGNYAMVCAIPYKGDPHYDLGMQTEFTIE